MAMNFLLKRSGTPDKRPDPTAMALGEIDLNYDATTGGVFYKDSNGDVVKVGSAQVSATAPNATPAGSAGNSTGEFWYDTANSELKLWNGSTWVTTGGGGGGGGVAGVTGTSPITVDNTDPANPDIGVDAASTTAAGVVQLDDTVTSTSDTEAATANAAKTAYDAGIQGQTDAAAALAAANAAGTDVGTLASLTTTDKSSAVAAINEVNAAASSAQGDATQAISDAAAAQSDADQAILDAAAAQGDATQALSDAASAQTAANNAQSDATQALSDASAAQSDATQALSDAAAAQATADAAVPDASYTALGDILSGTGAGTYSSLPLGTDTQVLTVDTTCPGGVKWDDGGGGGGSLPATPAALGTVYGFTDVPSLNTALGEGAFFTYSTATGERNTLIGACSGTSLTSGGWNTGVGQGVYGALTTGCGNVLMGGPETMGRLVSGDCNTALGNEALSQATTGSYNLGVGSRAGYAITTGSYNVALGPNAQVASDTDCCQLAIGFSATENWLTGDSTKAIKPGAGIIDCAGSCGTAGQVLQSNGSNAVQWATPSSGFSGYNGYTSTTSGTKFNVTGYQGELGINFAGQLNIFTIYNSAPAGETPHTPGSNALIFLNGINGVGTSTIQAMNISTGTFAVESVLYPAYSDITVTFTPSVTTDRMNFYIKFADATGNGGPGNFGSFFTTYLTIF